MKDVLARIQAINTPGNIRVELDGEIVRVWSRHDIADAVFEIIPPAGDLMVLCGDLQADAFVTLHELDG